MKTATPDSTTSDHLRTNNFEHPELPSLIRRMNALLRSRGVDAHDAEDITQNALVRLWVSHSAQRAGWIHFTRFALMAVKHSHAAWLRYNLAAKRGGEGTRWVSIDRAGEIPAPTSTAPDTVACSRELAELVRESISAVRESYEQRGQKELVAELESLNTGTPTPADRACASRRLGMKLNTLRVAALRHRRHCQAAFSARREDFAA